MSQVIGVRSYFPHVRGEEGFSAEEIDEGIAIHLKYAAEDARRKQAAAAPTDPNAKRTPPRDDAANDGPTTP